MECRACNGAHRAHTCGKSRTAPSPRRAIAKQAAAANQLKPTRKRRATAKAAKLAKAAEAKQRRVARGLGLPSSPRKHTRTGRGRSAASDVKCETLREEDLEGEAGALSELEWWRSDDVREARPLAGGSTYYEQHMPGSATDARKSGSSVAQRKARANAMNAGKIVSLPLARPEPEALDFSAATGCIAASPAGRSGAGSADTSWGQIKLSPSVGGVVAPRCNFGEHDPDSELAPLRPRKMSLDWQPGVPPVPPVIRAADVVHDEMLHSALQGMRDARNSSNSSNELEGWW